MFWELCGVLGRDGRITEEVHTGLFSEGHWSEVLGGGPGIRLNFQFALKGGSIGIFFRALSQSQHFGVFGCLKRELSLEGEDSFLNTVNGLCLHLCLPWEAS